MSHTSSFKPAWWLRNGHLQTVYARFVGRRRHVETRQEIVELPDGDFLDCRWVGPDTGPILIVLHGLEGSAQSHYAKGIAQAAALRGWRAVLMHFRSCGGQMNRLPRCYHSGDTGDFNYLIHVLKAREPETPLCAVGYSMGGNVLLKWLGEAGAKSMLQGAVAVSVPFELNKAAEKMAARRGANRFYQNYFLKPLKRKILLKLEKHDLPFNPQKIESIRTIQEYDEMITAPLHGFTNSLEYYRQSSSKFYLNRIATPTLIIHAKDDPFMTLDMIPRDEEVSPAVTLELFDKGGHVGFVSGTNPLKPRYWLEERIPLFFETVLR